MAGKGPLEQFYRDTLKFGNLKCFRHFQMYLKGREEIVVTVFSGANTSPRVTTPLFKAIQKQGNQGVNQLPPASPATQDLELHNPDVTVFLIGAYAKYNWPYVWLRSMSRHASVEDMDAPLDLPSTKNWKAHGLKVWDIIAELIELNITPQPSNAFAVSFDTLMEMPPFERALQAGAMASFLREVLMTCKSGVEGVKEDMARCMEIHFKDMPSVVPKMPGVSITPAAHLGPKV